MFKTLLLPVDRSSLAEQAIPRAAAIARASQAAIDVFMVHDAAPGAELPWTDERRAHDQQYVDAIAAELASGAGVKTTSAVVSGSPSEAICERAAAIHADLIVMTSHGRTGFSRAWLGSVADAVIRHASVPVLMLRPDEQLKSRVPRAKPFAHVLVPLDGAPLSAEILPTALDLARANDAAVTLLRVVPVVPQTVAAYDPSMPLAFMPVVPDDEATRLLADDAKKELHAVAERLVRETCFHVEAKVEIADRTAEAIVGFARGHSVDVIAMSTHGRGASRLLVGSVADKVLRGSGLPVLMRRPAGVREATPLMTEESVSAQLPSIAGA